MGKYVDISKFTIDAVKGSSIEFDAGILYALRKLEEQPTVDAVEVVRCKDCIYYENFLCGRFSAYGNSVEEPEYDYCSYGEMK